MMMGLKPIKDINYDLVEELIEATEGLNYERVKELLNEPECDVNCPRYVVMRSHFGYMFKSPFKAAHDTKDMEMFKLYLECDRVDVLTWFGMPIWEENFEWKQYYRCDCRKCEHEQSVLWLFSEFEELAYERIQRDLVKREGNLELLPFYVTNFPSASFFQDSLQHMTDVNAKNSYGYTLLNWLVKPRDINIEAQLTALLERNPDLSIETPDKTPVMVVLYDSYIQNRDLLNKLARSLMAHGADILATNSEGKNYIDFDYELESTLPYESPLFPQIMKAYILSPKSKNFHCLAKIIEASEEARQIWLELVPIVMKERFLSREIEEIAHRMEDLFKELLAVKQDFDNAAKLKFIRIIINRFSDYALEYTENKLNISKAFFKEHKNVLLHECVDRSRLSLVQKFLNVYRADPNSIVGGLRPLFRCNNLKICAELIKAGADPLYDDGKGKFFNRIFLKYVTESDFQNLMKLLRSKAIQIDEPNPVTGKTFAYILAEDGFLCPIKNINLNLVINNVPLFANLKRLDKFFELTKGRDIDYLVPDSEGNTFLHRLGQFKKTSEYYSDIFANPKMSSYFLDEKNNKGETPFDIFVMKADEEMHSFDILRELIRTLIACQMNEKLNIVLNRLKQKREENGSLLFDRYCEHFLKDAIKSGNLELCKFWIEEYNVDPNAVHIPGLFSYTDDDPDSSIDEDVAIYLVQKEYKCKIALLVCAFEYEWQEFLDSFFKEMTTDDLKQLNLVLDGWDAGVPSCLLDFLSRADVKSHLEVSGLSNLLFSPQLTVEQAQLLIDLGADPLYFARTKSYFKNYQCYKIKSETWHFLKQTGLSLEHLKQMRVFNHPFLKQLSTNYAEEFELVIRIFAPIQLVASCKFQDLNNHQVIGDTEMCSICRDEFSDDDDLTILDCKHFFHTACVEYTLERHQDCPYCRTPIPLPSIEHLSLQVENVSQ